VVLVGPEALGFLWSRVPFSVYFFRVFLRLELFVLDSTFLLLLHVAAPLVWPWTPASRRIRRCLEV